MYVPKSDRKGAGQAVSSCGLLCGQNFDGFCVGWTGEGEKEKCPALRWLFAAKKDVAAKSA